MKIAALYDIHGNLPALEAVLEDVRRAGVDAVVVGGDVVPGPMPRETLARLLDLGIPTHFIRGNGEHAVLEALAGREPVTISEPYREPIRWVARQLGAEDGETLAAWPATLRLEIEGIGQVLFCHATPRDDNEIFTRLTPESRLLPIFASAGVPLVVCGHTHMQFERTVGGTRVVNAGSVGMPFGEPGAYWLLLGPGVELRRTDYDLAAAAERILATDYPGVDALVQRILQPPSAGEMLDAFSRREIGWREEPDLTRNGDGGQQEGR